ncbi:MAG: hypothetical protein ACD_31C00114G0003, partial [uncultured bacterium]
GWAFGPRYIIPAMAALSFFVGIFLTEFKYKFLAKIFAVILFAISCAISLLGVLTTNLVPPKVEAVYLNLKYGYTFNVDYLTRGQTGSFVYHNYFSQFSFIQYYFTILSILMIIVIFILFVLPLFTRRKVEG